MNMRPTRKCLIYASFLLTFIACDKPTSERIDDIYALKMNPTAENIATLRTFIEDASVDVRVTALNSLITLGVEDADQLAVSALEDEDAFVRATAAKLIGDMENPALSGFLIGRLERDPDPLVRKRACQGLLLSAGDDAGAAMVRALRDPDPQVRLAAIRGAKELAPGEGSERLIELLGQDPGWEIRVQAASALALTGDPAAGDALRAALEDPVEFVRGGAAKALQDYRPVYPDPEPVEPVSVPPSPDAEDAN